MLVLVYVRCVVVVTVVTYPYRFRVLALADAYFVVGVCYYDDWSFEEDAECQAFYLACPCAWFFQPGEVLVCGWFRCEAAASRAVDAFLYGQALTHGVLHY